MVVVKRTIYSAAETIIYIDAQSCPPIPVDMNNVQRPYATRTCIPPSMFYSLSLASLDCRSHRRTHCYCDPTRDRDQRLLMLIRHVKGLSNGCAAGMLQRGATYARCPSYDVLPIEIHKCLFLAREVVVLTQHLRERERAGVYERAYARAWRMQGRTDLVQLRLEKGYGKSCGRRAARVCRRETRPSLGSSYCCWSGDWSGDWSSCRWQGVLSDVCDLLFQVVKLSSTIERVEESQTPHDVRPCDATLRRDLCCDH